MPTFGSATKNNLPTSFKFSYDGVAKGWGTRLYSIGDITNQADPVDNKLRISDMRVSFIDTDGEIWTAMGNGTAAFRKSMAGTVIVGGSMGPVSDHLGVKYEKVSDVGAYTNVFHQGKVQEVSKRDNVVTIMSQNIMNLLPLVEWQLPVNRTDAFTQGSFYQKYSFCKDSGDATWGNLISKAGFNKSDGNEKADFYAFPTSSGIAAGYGTDVEGIYDTSAGTGIEDTLVSPCVFLNDQFYRDFAAVKFKGTLLGVLTGTINTEEKAKEVGYDSLSQADAAKSGETYTLNKMRFEWGGGTADSTKPDVYYRGMFTMEGDPTAILRHLLFGKMVTSYYSETDNMGTDTFYAAAKVTAFKFYGQTIDPNDPKVLPYINNLLSTESALFYVDSKNQFNFEPYGPKNLADELGSIGSAQIVDAQHYNAIEDAYNRIEIRYGYDFTNKEFSDTICGTLDGWAIQDDMPLKIESNWLKQGNQVSVSLARLLSRYKNTLPKANFTTSLKYSDTEIGTLVKVSDADSDLEDKIIQITDYRKKFGNSNQINFSGYDGESLFSRRGYAFWEDGVSSGGTAPVHAVTGTSTSGWGTNGTVAGINESIFGTQFVWW